MVPDPASCGVEQMDQGFKNRSKQACWATCPHWLALKSQRCSAYMRQDAVLGAWQLPAALEHIQPLLDSGS